VLQSYKTYKIFNHDVVIYGTSWSSYASVVWEKALKLQNIFCCVPQKQVDMRVSK